MSIYIQGELVVATPGRGTTDITAQVDRCVRESGVVTGLCEVFVQHTSASLMLCENADPQVRDDLESFMGKLVPDGDDLFRHTQEGPDDMPAHVRSILTMPHLSLPVREARCALGTWQGIYLWEHRTAPHRRRIALTIHGEV